MNGSRNHFKNAELLSLTGAVVAGAGAALLLSDWLDAFKLLMLVGGLAVHAAAMFYRRRLEQAADHKMTRWENLLYWSCWFFIALLAVYIVATAYGRSAA